MRRVGGPNELKAIWDQAQKPGAYPPDLRRQALEWLAEAAVLRKVRPGGDLSAASAILTEALDVSNLGQRPAAIRLIAAWKLETARKSIQELAGSDREPIEIRQPAVEALAAFADEESKKVLTKLATTGSVANRLLAASNLAGLDLDGAALAAAAAISEATASDEPGVVLDAFLNRKGGPEKLGAALSKVKLAADPAKKLLRQLYQAGRNDAVLSDQLSRAAGIAKETRLPTADEVKKIVAEMEQKGDPIRGERIFRRADLGCMRCHSVAKAGGSIGPELSALGASSPADYVVTSILDPNAAIKEAYLTKVIATSKGQLFTGIVVERDNTRVILKDATGKQIRIPVADIDEEANGKSLMPEGLTRFLTHEELLDLSRFVAELGKPGPFGIRTTPTVQRWKLLKQPSPLLTREVPTEEVFRDGVLGSKPEDWESVYGMVSGVLPLEELHKTPKEQVLYLQGEVDVTQPGPVTVRLECGQPHHLWIDGRLATDKKADVMLSKGRHRMTVRVLLSAEKPGTLKMELIRPEGSNAQFEVVNGT